MKKKEKKEALLEGVIRSEDSLRMRFVVQLQWSLLI
jgi:hypothetical protein